MNPPKSRERGAIWLHRAIRQSAIWNAPPEYLKVWLHILLTVPFSGDRIGERAFFSSREDCPDVSPDQWSRAIAWLREKKSISTTKIRHGVLIKVVNYAQYQMLNGAKQTSLPTAPLSAIWQQATGGKLSGRSLAGLERLLTSHGAEKVTTALTNYLAATESRFASIARLEETFGTWLAEPKPKTSPGPARGRSALTGHKGGTDYDAIDPTA
jgi:hypothetical protein